MFLMTRFKTEICHEAYLIITESVYNTAVQMFNFSISNVTGISFQETTGWIISTSVGRSWLDGGMLQFLFICGFCGFDYVPICELILKLIVKSQIRINVELNQTHNSHSLR